MTATAGSIDVVQRARSSRGSSAVPIYRVVTELLRDRHPGGGTLLDAGCGTGTVWRYAGDQFSRYVGVDIVCYDGFPAGGEFLRRDLDVGRIDLGDGIAEVVVTIETIEHLENPRAFTRELSRLCKPGGWLVVTTPNQLSMLSKLTLVVKNEFNAFQEGSYPAHLTALLEADLRRIARECGLTDVVVRYTGSGRIPGTAAHYPGWLSRRLPRSLSDNVILIARKP